MITQRLSKFFPRRRLARTIAADLARRPAADEFSEQDGPFVMLTRTMETSHQRRRLVAGTRGRVVGTIRGRWIISFPGAAVQVPAGSDLVKVV